MTSRRKAPDRLEPERRQIGVRIAVDLWTQVRILALEQRKDGFEVLEDAIREHLKRHGKEVNE